MVVGERPMDSQKPSGSDSWLWAEGLTFGGYCILQTQGDIKSGEHCHSTNIDMI